MDVARLNKFVLHVERANRPLNMPKNGLIIECDIVNYLPAMWSV